MDAATYAYDAIGNRVFHAVNAVTNTYSANNLNQYAGLSYDADGNLLSDGEHTFSWDAENRLETVTPENATNGSLRVVNRYDHRHRRVTKEVFELSGYTPPYGEPPVPGEPGEWGLLRTHTFFYDGWNLALEKVAYTNGTADRIEYVWGLDLSGTLQGAGGVAVLLFEKRNGQIFIPLYDANGNVTDYVDASGAVVAHREYDPFGRTTVATGPLVHALHFWFSTKYLDEETGLYYYGERFYSPELMRWLSRDPIGESGGINRYLFLFNNSINYFDPYGMYEYEFKSSFTSKEKQDIQESIIRVGSRCKQLVEQADKEIDELENCPCYKKLVKNIESLKKLLEGMIKEIGNPRLNLEVYRNDFGGDPEGTYWNSPGPWCDDELTLDNGWFNKAQKECDRTMFHELSHGQKTVDENFDVPYRNSHVIEKLMNQDIEDWTQFQFDKNMQKKECKK